MNGKTVFALFSMVVLGVATASVHAQTGASLPKGGAPGGRRSAQSRRYRTRSRGQPAVGSEAVARDCSSRRDLRLRCLRKS